MKRIALALALLSACQPSKKDDTTPDPNAELVAAAQLMFDMTKVNEGDWARYTISETGKSPQVVKYAVVRGDPPDPDSIWIENKVPGDPSPFIIKSRYSRQGELLERWVGEPGSPKPAKIFPTDKKTETPKQPEEPKVQTEISQERITVAGRSFDCTKIVTTLTYSSGRTSTLTNWCHPDVPFSVLHEGKSYGGLVKREFGKIKMELAAFGPPPLAKAELEIPK